MSEARFNKVAFHSYIKNALNGRKILHREVIQKVENWMDSGKYGLLLMGSIGTGKTTLGWALRMGWCKFLTVADIKKCDWIAEKVKQDADWVNEIARVKGLMVLDDLGTESKVWGEESMLPILYRRIDAWMPTVITTNLNTDQIRERYGERLIDRLRTFDKIVLNYDSLRGNDTDNH